MTDFAWFFQPAFTQFQSNFWPNWFLFNALIAMGAILIDRLFGEFLSNHHPVVWIGRWISWFEKRYYQDRLLRGGWLWISTLLISGLIGLLITLGLAQLPTLIALFIGAVLASTLLAHRMLFDSVLAVAQAQQPAQAVSMLVSRDTQKMTDSDAYKAAIETYAENLSDGVVAPWLFLLCFGLPGILLYKAINTLDSMVGYRTEKYENYGKVAAIGDDLANWIPARITAALIMLSFKNWAFWAFYTYGVHHSSPNAGHPISAMALCCHCRLGGPTRYFGKLQKKAYFGSSDASPDISPAMIYCALSQRNRLDSILIALSLFAATIGLFNT